MYFWQVYEALSKVSPMFTIAAAFGNVHGVYKPGNVKLQPGILGTSQKYIQDKLGSGPKPVYFVFHGVVKMNVDTDTQWAYWEGLKDYYEAKKDYLQGQIGNPDGPEKPNKKFYDPRVWLRKAEETMIKRVKEASDDLGNKDKL